MASGEELLGDIASVLLCENERVRIWNLIVEPGESSPWHVHDHDYLTVVLEGGALTVESADGTSDELSVEVGDWKYASGHQVHRVVNKTNLRYKNVLVEFK